MKIFFRPPLTEPQLSNVEKRATIIVQRAYLPQAGIDNRQRFRC